MSPTALLLAKLVGLLALALTCAAAAWRGERSEQLGAALISAAWLINPLLEQRRSWYAPQFGILAADVATLMGLVILVFVYKRYWTICATAFQAIAVLTHVAFLIDPRALYRAYFMANFSIGFLLLGAILGGVVIESAPRRLSPPARRQQGSSAP